MLLTVCPKDLFLTCGKDTPNTTKDRDMTFTSTARFLILGPAFLLRAVLSPPTDLHPGFCYAVLAPCSLPHGEGSAFDPQPGWEDCDTYYASKMKRFGKCGFLTGFCRGGVVGFRG